MAKMRKFRFCVYLALSGILISVAPALAVNNGNVPINTPASARRMIEDLNKNFGKKYKGGKEFLKRLCAIEEKLAANKADNQAAADLAALIREAAIANPLLDFDKLLVIRRTREANRSLNAYTSDTIKRTGWDNEISELSNLRGEVKVRTVYRHPKTSVMKHMDLHFDGKRIMFSGLGANGRWGILEVDANGKNVKELTPSDQKDIQWFDGCYLPEADYIVGCSTAGMQGLPCVNGSQPMVNLYKVNTKTRQVRQLTFEQDSDWHPRVHHNGKVLYLRWEYTDTPHYFTRVMMSMNPDGTNQLAYYGSNSYWPNALFFSRPIPGSSTKFVGIVGGHHGIPRMGEMVVFDAARGRHEASGVIQRIPGYGKEVKPIIRDALVNGSWPLFIHPLPLSEKYYLVSRPIQRGSKDWGIFLVDVFDNMLLLKAIGGNSLVEPIPLRPTKCPPVIPSKINPNMKDGVLYVQSVYNGPGLKGVPNVYFCPPPWLS